MTAKKINPINDLVKLSVQVFPDDISGAVDRMHSEVMSDLEGHSEFIDPLIKAACYSKISLAFRIQNGVIWNTPGCDGSQEGNRLRSVAAGEVLRLMDYRLLGGKRLADAEKEEIQENAEFHSKQGERMLQTADWFARIAKALKPGKSVSKVFTEGDLQKLQNLARS